MSRFAPATDVSKWGVQMTAGDFLESGSGAPIFPEVDRDRVIHFLGVDEVTQMPLFMSSEKVYEQISRNTDYINNRVSTDQIHDPTGAIRELVLDIPHVQGLVMWSKDYHGRVVFGARYMVKAHHLTWYAKVELNAGLRKQNTLTYIGELPCQSLLSHTAVYDFSARRSSSYRDAPNVFSSRLATAISEKLATRMHQTENGLMQTHVIVKATGERVEMAILLHWMAARESSEALGDQMESEGVQLMTIGQIQDHPSTSGLKRASAREFASRIMESKELMTDFLESACGDAEFLETYGAQECSCILNPSNTFFHSSVRSSNQEMDIFFNCREVLTRGPHYAVGFPSGKVHECGGHIQGLIFPSYYDEGEADGDHFFGASTHRTVSQPRERLSDFA
jgi:hypothetical protein